MGAGERVETMDLLDDLGTNDLDASEVVLVLGFSGSFLLVAATRRDLAC